MGQHGLGAQAQSAVTRRATFGWPFLWFGSAASAAPGPEPGAAQADTLRQAIRRHGVALMLRHAQTEPGIGDPPGFQLDRCETQRNLSEAGRAQSRRIGEWLASYALVPDEVRTSQWCRCRDTAALLGQVLRMAHTDWPALNSFFAERAAEAPQSAQVRAALAGLRPGQFRLWVTHQVNITALAAEVPAMGEAFALGPAPTLGILSRLRFAP
jgi:phosphohistidine phosphatase SixA